jgi:hypothetical protein
LALATSEISQQKEHELREYATYLKFEAPQFMVAVLLVSLFQPPEESWTITQARVKISLLLGPGSYQKLFSFQ